MSLPDDDSCATMLGCNVTYNIPHRIDYFSQYASEYETDYYGSSPSSIYEQTSTQSNNEEEYHSDEELPLCPLVLPAKHSTNNRCEEKNNNNNNLSEQYVSLPFSDPKKKVRTSNMESDNGLLQHLITEPTVALNSTKHFDNKLPYTKSFDSYKQLLIYVRIMSQSSKYVQQLQQQNDRSIEDVVLELCNDLSRFTQEFHLFFPCHQGRHFENYSFETVNTTVIGDSAAISKIKNEILLMVIEVLTDINNIQTTAFKSNRLIKNRAKIDLSSERLLTSFNIVEKYMPPFLLELNPYIKTLIPMIFDEVVFWPESIDTSFLFNSVVRIDVGNRIVMQSFMHYLNSTYDNYIVSYLISELKVAKVVAWLSSFCLSAYATKEEKYLLKAPIHLNQMLIRGFISPVFLMIMIKLKDTMNNLFYDVFSSFKKEVFYGSGMTVEFPKYAALKMFNLSRIHPDSVDYLIKIEKQHLKAQSDAHEQQSSNATTLISIDLSETDKEKDIHTKQNYSSDTRSSSASTFVQQSVSDSKTYASVTSSSVPSSSSSSHIPKKI